ncbi:sensor histidine kinase [Allosalinactinospora lopnorensis]|uniref:sensor histidine kinase n=1 Tax=Allosalinactinospora lopnorensis TaxID=1352348 RepID=UPI000623D266|nr:sensor histidine kinase [Allosalinactinospora lopnorensis]
MTSCAESDGTGSEGFEHYGVFVDSTRDLHEIIVSRIRAALAEGDHVTVAVSPRHEETLRSALGGRPDTDLDFTDRAGLYDAPGRTLAALHRLTLARPMRHVTVVGEPVLPDDPLELREWHRLDSALDSALAGTRLRLLCLHDTRTLPGEIQRIVRRTHPILVARTGVWSSPDYRDPVAFSAPDADRSLPPPSGDVRTVEVRSDLLALREEVSGLAATTGLPPPRIGDLVMAVNELAANVLEHGAGKGTISVWRSSGRIVCDVFDEDGSLTDPLGGYHPADPLSPRGYGLWITRQVCDFMEISGGRHGSLIRMYFRSD